MTKYETQWQSLYRSGIEAMMDMTKTGLEGMERLQSNQLKTLNDMLTDARDADKKLKTAKNLDELLELHAEFAPTSTGRAIGYWGGIVAGATRYQMEIAKQTQLKVADVVRDYRANAESGVTAADQMIAPLKSAVTALCSVYSMTARATDEATRVATAPNSFEVEHNQHAAPEPRRKAA